MVWNGETPKRRLTMPENDVAPLLTIDFVAEPAKGGHGVPARNSGEDAQTATSTTSS
jgi:hypothetical protein